ncbi:MAG: hypothetical protein WAN39_02805 [Candidatus Cybelea sp.]|jgi:hypothetical protein
MLLLLPEAWVSAPGYDGGSAPAAALLSEVPGELAAADELAPDVSEALVAAAFVVSEALVAEALDWSELLEDLLLHAVIVSIAATNTSDRLRKRIRVLLKWMQRLGGPPLSGGRLVRGL